MQMGSLVAVSGEGGSQMLPEDLVTASCNIQIGSLVAVSSEGGSQMLSEDLVTVSCDIQTGSLVAVSGEVGISNTGIVPSILLFIIRLLTKRTSILTCQCNKRFPDTHYYT